jgi:DNA-binding CsgD family transcriptional regulator
MNELALKRPIRAKAVASLVLPDFSASGGVEATSLSSLVASLYDAALEPEQWPAVLDRCREFIGGMSAAIFSKDAAGQLGQIYYADGNIDPHYARLYFERYAPLDPANAGHLFADVEQPISTHDILDYDEFRESRFFKEWVEPQGMVDFISASIEKVGSRAVMFGVFRHQRDGFVDEAARRRMRLLVPHVRRAVLIGKVIERGSFEAASLGDALDGLAAGMFLVDATGHLVHANDAGHAMLRAGSPVVARDGRILSSDRAAAASLAEVFAAAGGGDTAVGVRGISISIQPDDEEHYVAHVVPLTSGARRRTGASYAAVAALFIQRATLSTPAAPEVIAKTFGLTVSELRVLVTIVQIGGIAETAEALGVAEATVKTHLHRVFAKTGTARQADLVKLVAGFASPLSR